MRGVRDSSECLLQGSSPATSNDRQGSPRHSPKKLGSSSRLGYAAKYENTPKPMLLETLKSAKGLLASSIEEQKKLEISNRHLREEVSRYEEIMRQQGKPLWFGCLIVCRGSQQSQRGECGKDPREGKRGQIRRAPKHEGHRASAPVIHQRLADAFHRVTQFHSGGDQGRCG